MDFLYELHPISIAGMGLSIPGLFMVCFLFFNNELVFKGIQLKGNLHRSKKWPVMQKTAIGFLVAGALVFAYGFNFPKPQQVGGGVDWKKWKGNWDIEILGDYYTGKGKYRANFDQIRKEILQAKLYDDNEEEWGSFQRLNPTSNPNDYGLLKGQFFQKNGEKSIVVELALHADKETFSGVIYEKYSAKKITCWGKKR